MCAADAVHAADAHADIGSDAINIDKSYQQRRNAVTSTTSKSYFWSGNDGWWRGIFHASEWPPKCKLDAGCKFCCLYFICFVGRVCCIQITELHVSSFLRKYHICNMCAAPYPASQLLAQADKPTLKADQYDSLLYDIQDFIEDKERWKGSIKLKDGDGNDVDLCDWLGKQSSKSRGSVLILSGKHGKSDADVVREYIVAAAKEQGMILRAQIDSTRREPRIKFRCYRNGTYKPKKDAKKKQYADGAAYATNVRQGSTGKQSAKSKKKHGLHARKTNTALPLDDDDRCPFNFIVSWSPYGEERWCVVAKDGCPHHEGHKPDMPSETKATINDVGDEGRQTIKDVLDAGGTPTVAQIMVRKILPMLLRTIVMSGADEATMATIFVYLAGVMKEIRS